MEYTRSQRVEELIRQVLSGILIKDVKDPRLDLVTITEVRITPDLHKATVYFSRLGNKKKRHEAKEAMDKAAGMLRLELGKSMALRYVPELEFKIDDTIEQSMKIEKILKNLKPESDEPDER